MSQTDMLRTVDEVRAAIGRGDQVERKMASGNWRPVPNTSDLSILNHLFADGYQFRIASPSRQARGSQVVSDDDVSAMVSAYNVARNYDECMHHQAMRAAASALLARRPAQGEVAMLSWSGFNVHGDAASIAEVKRTVHNCGQFDAGFRHPAPTAAPAGASTHAAWPTREELREVARATQNGTYVEMCDAIADAIHARLTVAGGRDGEGS